MSELKVLKMKVAWMMLTTINKSMHRIKVIFQVLLNLENDCQEDQFYDSGHGVEVLQIVSSDWVRQVSGTLSQQESLFIHISKMSIVWLDINHVLIGFGYFFGNVSETSTYKKRRDLLIGSDCLALHDHIKQNHGLEYKPAWLEQFW